MKMRLLLFLIGMILFLSCKNQASKEFVPQQNQEVENPSPAYYKLFYPIDPTDTLRITIEEELQGKLIPKSLIPSNFRKTPLGVEGEYENSVVKDDTLFFAYWRMPMQNQKELLLVGGHLGWDRFKYLWVYDKQYQSLSSPVLLAYRMSNDLGQIRAASWLFDQNANQALDILHRSSDFGLMIINDELQEGYIEKVKLWEWQSESFQEQTVQDSSKWISTFPIVWKE